jgi:membrane-bound serine protease (ClpP class)
MSRFKAAIAVFLVALPFALLWPAGGSAANGGAVVELVIDGAIGPATEDYIARALRNAGEQQARLVVIRMDTPGGLDSAMRNIIREISNSPIPVASFVAPTGARAASAGTYILYASHVAAMVPGTNLGAATPVQLGGAPAPPSAPSPAPPDAGKDGGKADPRAAPDAAGNDQAMRNKLVNDAVAYIRGLAELHGRNADWAEKSVREGASLTASAALEQDVIDLIAADLADLLAQIDGREVSLQGKPHTLATAGAAIRQIEPDWRNRLLAVITNPNIAYILLLIGIYGLIFEFSNPGAVVPGTVGAISLLLALYALQMLPINYAGVGLMLLGVALMIGEAFAPSFGVLGIGGVAAFVLGSIILIDTEAPGFGIDLSVIAVFSLLSALVFIFIVGMAFRARRHPVVSGMSELVGGTATVLEDFHGRGAVRIHSEIWQADSDSTLRKGQRVRVTGIDGLILRVEPIA